MRFFNSCNVGFFVLLIISLINGERNLSCYQCIRKANEECDVQDLKPCPPVMDRCVTHIEKKANGSFSIKRECGLGRCAFDDAMANKGLGFDRCDRSRHEYFCLFCCRESGCNKSHASLVNFNGFLVVLFDVIYMLLKIM